MLERKLSRVERHQKGLKQFLIDCFTKLGEKLDIQFPSCACSSYEDFIALVSMPSRRRVEGGSTSAPSARLDDPISKRRGKESAVEEEDSDDEIGDYIPKTDED